MAESTSPRSLADQFRGWSDADLLSLLQARPDVAAPAPQDSAQLASRAGTRASAIRAVNQLTALELTVLGAAVGLGGPTSVAVLHTTVDADPKRVIAAVARLRALALLWGPDEALRAVSVLTDVVSTAPYQGQVGDPPDLITSPRDQSIVDRVGAGAAFDFVRHVELMAEQWATRPPPALRGGGVGIRDLRLIARLLHVTEPVAALHVETAAAAGLLAVAETDVLGTVWLPTDAYDIWAAGSVADRWVRLALAWLPNPRLTGLVGSRDSTDKPVNVLVPGLERTWLPETRRMCLQEIARLSLGTVLAADNGPESLAARLRWLRPRRPADRTRAIGWVLDEAAVLGVMGLGGLASHGHALLAADPRHEAPTVLEPLLPPSVDHVLIQADLTAIAPGPLEQGLARDLALVADVESRGGATVYRFNAQSVRRAFDAGWSAAEVHAFVTSTSRTPVPQPLTYLVDDVARTFGTVRVGTAESFIRSDDESALTELLHDQKASGLRLRRIAPTVVVSDAPIDIVVSRLRELGVSPVLEAPDGTVQIARKDSRRARASKPATSPSSLSAERLQRTIAAIRAGDRAAAARPRRQEPARRTPPGLVLAALREAADAKHTVWIGYVDNQGMTKERVVDPVHVHAGQLTAYDHRADEVRLFAVHRITGVAAVDTRG